MRADPLVTVSRAADRALHARLVAGDPTAPSDLIDTHLPRLMDRLRRKFPRMDPWDLEEIAMGSVTRIAMEPTRYDPARSALGTYLYLDASRDALNAIARTKRRAEHEISLEAVELSAPTRNTLATDKGDPEARLVGKENERMTQAWLVKHFDQMDRELVQLVYAGERRTETFARALGIDHLPLPEQRRRVKRHKDRINARLRRLGIQGPDHG